jgi:DNA-binding protein YbaB
MTEIDIDEEWLEAAVQNYQRLDALRSRFRNAVETVEVRVTSPDGLVEVVVAADGQFRDVVIAERAVRGLSVAELSKAVLTVCRDARGAADWARRKLYEETFRGFGG